jgi:hypothetical protein
VTVFCDVAPCILVETARRFRGTYCLQHEVIIALMMVAENISEYFIIQKRRKIA